MNPKEMYDLVELIELLKSKKAPANVNFAKALLTLAYEIHLVQEAIEDMDNDIRGYDP